MRSLAEAARPTSPRFCRQRAALWLALLVLATIASCQQSSDRFDGRRAYAHVEALCEFGPRPVGSAANRKAASYIESTLVEYGWHVEVQEFAFRGESLQNVIGRKGEGPIIIIGAHFDTRPLADNDPTDRSKPVMGANDGGSGTAVLLELARVLGSSATDQAEVWLAFFDGEDRGNIDDWPWSVGASHVADDVAGHREKRPEYVLILDMIGDTDQRIYYEWSSVLWLQEKLWGIAEKLGHREHFIPQHRYRIIDDHSPFLHWGIPAAVVIDFDYPYWHTRSDTIDQVSADSLQRVGETVEALLEGEPFVAASDQVVP